MIDIQCEHITASSTDCSGTIEEANTSDILTGVDNIIILIEDMKARIASNTEEVINLQNEVSTTSLNILKTGYVNTFFIISILWLLVLIFLNKIIIKRND